MSMPGFGYVGPEQVMRDRADYARKGIARGRSLVGLTCNEGVLLAAENPSRSLHKVSELYDRIGFAGVGKYNEFDQLRLAGIRSADVRGYNYSREDVDGRSLANVYAQYLGNVFTHEMKPMEVEILVAQVGTTPDDDELYHILYDGTVFDEEHHSVIGGDAEAIAGRLKEAWRPDQPLAEAFKAATTALAGPDRKLTPSELEAAVLERSAERRAFRRLDADELAELLA